VGIDDEGVEDPRVVLLDFLLTFADQTDQSILHLLQFLVSLGITLRISSLLLLSYLRI
jgi:hypothetical protein